MFNGAVGWIDFDEDERKQVDAVIDAFRDRGTIDELGFGRIRDSFADLLAPGVSTLQTRVRYFLFVPWLFQKLEGDETPGSEFRQKLRTREIELIDALDRGEDDQGIIGIVSRENLSRFPSSIYWNGLRAWGILRFDGSQRRYVDQVDELYRHRDSTVYGDDGDAVSALPDDPWHPGMPTPPDGMLDETSFQLPPAEARYLVERIQESPECAESLLSELTAPGHLRDVSDVAVPWAVPLRRETPDRLRETLHHARNFARLTRGAALTYNLLLGDRKGARELEAELEVKLNRWLENVVDPLEATLRNWSWRDLREVLLRATGHRVDFESTVHGFLDPWREAALAADRAADLRTSDVERLIQRREHQMKGGRARLSNPKALANWEGESGTGLQTYRWQQVQAFVTDIAEALGA